MKHKIIYLFLAVSLAAGANTYAQQEAVDEEAFARIRQAELSSSQIPQIAHNLLDVAGPRLPNSPGYLRASNWAVQTMKKWGLANTALEPWGEFGRGWELQDFSIMMKVPYPAPLLAYPEPWCANTNGLQQGKVILLSNKQASDTTYLAAHLAELKGKIILLTADPVNALQGYIPDAPRFSDTALANIQEQHLVTRATMEQALQRDKIRLRIAILLKKAGVLARIVARADNANGVLQVQSNGGFKRSDPEGIPRLSMSFEHGQRIQRLIQSGHEVELAINVNATWTDRDLQGHNVIAEIPGTDPELKSQLVMLGGHLDSWQAATGATDNGAGCIVVMEAMRLLDSLGLKPKRTIRLALWDGEEEGLYGSYNYAQKHFMDKDFNFKPEQKKVSVYFNLDYGTGKIRGIYTQGNTAIKPIFEQWFKPFHDLGATEVTLKNTGSTDHDSFDWAGIPGFQFIQDPVDENRTHHTNFDDYDHLQIDDLKQAAIIIASFVYQASIRPDMMPRKQFVKATFIYDGF